MKTKILALSLALAMGEPVTAAQNDFAHFSFPLLNQAIDSSLQQPHRTSSDEYSLQVSGSALNKGVVLDLTQGQALILLSRAAQAQTLNSDLLSIHSAATARPMLAERISDAQLAQSGVFSHTLALKTTDQAGQAILKSTQPLSDKDSYRITVKEKNSPYKLHVQVDSQSYTDAQPVRVQASLQHLQQALTPGQTRATLVAPDGKVQALLVGYQGDGRIDIALPQVRQPLPPRQGLYEVRLSTEAKDNGVKIRRDGKIALALSSKQASLVSATLTSTSPLVAEVTLHVDTASRYEVRAMLYGTDQQGTLHPVMETHAAQTLEAGSATLALPFDGEILKASGLDQPYVLRHVRLFDQRQLGLMDSLAEARL